MDLLAFVAELFNDPLVGGIIGAAATFALADFAVSVGVAIRDKAFDGAYVAEWVNSHLTARVLPLSVVAILGHANPALAAVAVAALASYAVETVASLRQSLKADRGD